MENLAIEIFKIKHSQAPEIMTEFFRLKTRSFNTRNKFEVQWRNIKAINGCETYQSLGLQTSDLITMELRNLISLNAFKSKIKSWSTQKCPSTNFRELMLNY